MTHQIRSFAWRLAANVNLYQLVALGLALVAIAGPVMMPGGSGGGGGV